MKTKCIICQKDIYVPDEIKITGRRSGKTMLALSYFFKEKCCSIECFDQYIDIIRKQIFKEIKMAEIDGKVSQIEFHIDYYEIDDFIVRAAKLINEGYRVCSWKDDGTNPWMNTHNLEPKLHITLQKKGVY